MIAPAPHLLAIDPGTEVSAYVEVYGPTITQADIVDNLELLVMLRDAKAPWPRLVIEDIESYGMPVGREVFQTVRWTGRFEEAYEGPVEYLPRRQIKLALCGQSRAKDGNVRAAILDRYPRNGGGKVPQVGTKRNPGPLYGVKSHVWSALAVALAWQDIHREATV